MRFTNRVQGALPSGHFFFTSESVGEGHPDKICDQISDAILDECLTQDPLSKVAVETAIKSGFVFVFGVLTTTASVDVEDVVRRTLKAIGYDQPGMEIDWRTCEIMNGLEVYCPKPLDLRCLVDVAEEIEAGDQVCKFTKVISRSELDTGWTNAIGSPKGIMFGYATDETCSYSPLTIKLAHDITRAMKKARETGILPWLRPDTKAQVTLEYRHDYGAVVPVRAAVIVVSAQHSPGISLETLRSAIKEHILLKIIPSCYLDDSTIFLIQPSGDAGIVPSGKFAGVTGRKIVVDTYGGWGAHGGGAFSGKDFRQTDRSAAYLARWIAKSLVAAKLVRRCLIQISYSIGVVRPTSLYIETYGTSTLTQNDLIRIVSDNFDMRPGVVAKELGLTEPIYLQTARNGHFNNDTFPWEQPKKLYY